MKKHLSLTCFGYAAMGIGATVERLGVKAGINPFTVFVIFASCLIFFVVVVFTSMEKVKRSLYEKEIDKSSLENNEAKN